MYLLHMTEGVDKYRQSMNQGTTPVDAYASYNRGVTRI